MKGKFLRIYAVSAIAALLALPLSSFAQSSKTPNSSSRRSSTSLPTGTDHAGGTEKTSVRLGASADGPDSAEILANRRADADLIDAVSMYNAGLYDNAAAILKKILSANPKNDAAHYYLGLCYMTAQEHDAAEQELLAAISVDPGNFWYRQRLGLLYRYSRQIDQAILTYEKLLEDFPKKSDLYFDLAEMYVASGRNEKALDTINSIETVFGPTDSIVMYRFRLLLMMDRKEEAVKSLEEYNSKYSSPMILSALGDECLSSYEDEKAMTYYNEALELDSSYPPALLGKTEVLRMTRKYDEYFPMLKQYMSSEEVYPAAKAEYLQALIKESDPRFVTAFLPQLDTCVNACFRMHSSDTTVISAAASYYYITQRKDVGKDLFGLAAKVAPKSKTLAGTYLYALYNMESWKELSEAAGNAASDFPDEPDFMLLEGLAYYGMKDYDALISNCEQIIRKFPSDTSVTVRAYSTMGDVYHLKGDSKNSYKAYEKALKIAPDNVYILNNYAYYLALENKNLKKAYAMSKKTVEANPDEATYLDTFGWILYLQGKSLEAKPFFKHAMLYGGKDSVVIMDHYAEVLFSLSEYDLAFVYWNKALLKNNDEVPGLDEKVKQRREEMKQLQSAKKKK